jgi:hypothetical protein
MAKNERFGKGFPLLTNKKARLNLGGFLKKSKLS